jgi:hypothetical protein
MRIRHLLPAAALALGLAALAVAPSPAREPAEKADAAKIAQWIEQLGSDDRGAREKAAAALDAVGGPALEALHQAAAQATDVDVRLRTEHVAARIEKRQESAVLLAPKKVHLVYKDTPLPEAVEDFKKKTGYHIVLQDPDGKLKDRKVTLDTGDVTFWQALDQFCDKAGLKEAAPADVVAVPVPTDPKLPPPPPPPSKPIRPLPPEKAPPAEKEGQDGKAAPPAPVREEELKKREAEAAAREKERAAAAEAAARKEKEKAAAAQPPAADQPAPPVAKPPVAVPPGGPVAVPPGFVGPPAVGVQPAAADQITLVDGKADAGPADLSSAVRVRALPRADAYGPAPSGEYQIVLRLTAEPKLQFQSVDKATVTKAVDDQGQALKQATADVNPPVPQPAPGGDNAPGVAPPGGGPAILPIRPRPPVPVPAPPVVSVGSAEQTVVIRLKKGDKPAQSLKELTGSVSAYLLGEPEAVLTAPEILKAAGKSFKGAASGELKIIDVTKNDNSQVTVVFELTAPAGSVPMGGGTGTGVGVPIGPLPPIKGVPVPPGGAAGFGGGPAVGIIAVPPGGIGIGPGGLPAMNFDPTALKLLDDKGNAFQSNGVQPRPRKDANGFAVEYVATFTAEKGQGDATKLVYMARKTLSVEVPFTLKDVPLP